MTNLRSLYIIIHIVESEVKILINHKLKVLRAERQLNQTQVAEQLGITITSYCNKENGKEAFVYPEIIKLIEIFGVTFDDIFLHKNYTERTKGV